MTDPDDTGTLQMDYEALPASALAEREASFDFGTALDLLREGRRVQREGWNGTGMFLYFVKGSTFRVNREPLLSIFGQDIEIQYHGHIDMWTAQGYAVPWTASQADILAADWRVAD